MKPTDEALWDAYAEGRKDEAEERNAKPVGVVRIQQGYWSRGHFYDSERRYIEEINFNDLPEGTKLYALSPTWISVEERVAPMGEVVLVYTPDAKYGKFALDEWTEYREDPIGMGGPTIAVGEGWGDHEFEEITHWMPLPKPPKGKP